MGTGEKPLVTDRIAALLAATEHRPYELPAGPWVMQQSWAKLLFAHWPVRPESIREHIPRMLEIDTFEGSAWIGVVPFAMRKVYPRFTFEVPWMSNFLELNVRTYVKKNGIPGVYFFSLDCSNPVAVLLARSLFFLPYFNASMSLSSSGDLVQYHCRRSGSGAVFDADYRPRGPVFESTNGSVEQFLTERYCLYSVDRNSNCYRGNIHHARWLLQHAEAEIRSNELVFKQLGVKLPDMSPLLHYSENIDTVEWALQAI